MGARTIEGIVDRVGRMAVGGVARGADGRAVVVALRVGGRIVARTVAYPAWPGQTEVSACRFSFATRALWQYLSATDRVEVLAGDEVLPLAAGLDFPSLSGSRYPLANLLKMLDRGARFDIDGRLIRPATLNKRQGELGLALADRVRRTASRAKGLVVFVAGRSLIPLVRDAAFPAYESEVECSYISQASSPPAVRAEFYDLATCLIESGYQVRPTAAAILVRDERSPGSTLRLSPSFFDANGTLQSVAGSAGTEPYRRDANPAATTETFGKSRVTLLADPEALLRWTFGDDWRLADIAFDTEGDHVRRVHKAMLTQRQRDDLFWSSGPDNMPSRDAVVRLVDLVDDGDRVAIICDLGCGSGDGLVALAQRYPTAAVVGVERAPLLVARARARAAEGVWDIRLVEADMAEPAQAAAVLHGLRFAATASGGRLLVLLNRLLDSVSAGEQATIVAALTSHLRPGDLIAVECRRYDPALEPRSLARERRHRADWALLLDDRRFEPLTLETAPTLDEAGVTGVLRVILRRREDRVAISQRRPLRLAAA